MPLQDLLNILACPICKKEITLLEDENGLLCHRCGLKFPFREGIPVMLPDDAEKATNRPASEGDP
jgi:uncharacterized protein YbaR (Trm112 family)